MRSAAAAHANTAHTAFAGVSAAQADAAAEVTTTDVLETETESSVAGGEYNIDHGNVVVAPKFNNPQSNVESDDGAASADSAAADGVADAGHTNLVSDEVTSLSCHLQSLGPVST
jgi:hypothetical protein